MAARLTPKLRAPLVGATLRGRLGAEDLCLVAWVAIFLASLRSSELRIWLFSAGGYELVSLEVDWKRKI